MKKTICFIVLLFLVLLPKNVKALCSDTEMVRLQRVANNINISYMFNKNTKRFTIILTNLKNELIIKDLYEGTEYNKDGELYIYDNASGRHIYYIYSKNQSCGSGYISTKSVSLPFYNDYYKNELCNNHKGKYYCLKWIKSTISYNEWFRNVAKYNNESNANKENEKIESLFDIILSFYLKYYFILLPSIIVVLGTILIINNRKNRLG